METHVQQIVNAIETFYDRLENMKNHIDSMRADYRPDSPVMMGEVSKESKDFTQLYFNTENEISKQIDALRAIVEEDRKKAYVYSDDMKLLDGTVPLKKEDLDILVDKHRDNYLFVRAAYEYGQKNGIELKEANLALVNPFDARLARIDNLANMAKSCMRGGTFLEGCKAISANRQYFTLMSINGAFEKALQI